MKEQVVELRSATLVETDNLAIEHSRASTRRSHCLAKRIERVERVTVAGDELGSPVLNDGERTEPVVLQLEDPLGVIERQRSTRQRHGLECHRSGE